MNVEKQKTLINQHPYLYAKGVYFECGDGWFDLLMRLSAKLETRLAAIRKKFPDDPFYPWVTQVKEKYGTLRFYMSSADDFMWDCIEEAEKESAITCEECGKSGSVSRTARRWMVTRCEECLPNAV
jgi:hypothetical protein